MELLNYNQILLNLRRTAEKGYISLLHKQQLEELSLKYFGIKDSNGKYIGYMCPYSGKIYSRKSNLILEHIIPVDSKGGTVLFNCIPTSKEVNGRSEKGSKHLISWWINSQYWDKEAPIRLQKLVNYMLEAYEIIFNEYKIQELEDSYIEILEADDDLKTSKRQNNVIQEQSDSYNIHSYLGFLIDCINQLEKESIDTTNINEKLKELENKNIFKDIERYTLFQNILKQIIIKFTGEDTKLYLTYSIRFNIKKLMDTISYNNELEVYNEILSRILNIQELLSENNLVIEEYFNSLKDIELINLLYKPIESVANEEKQIFLSKIKLGIDTKISEYIELLNQGYKPKSEDKKNKFSNGEPINYFWRAHKEKIKERLTIDERYQEGYEIAIQIISFDKIAEYIELLNQGYKPRNEDKATKFSNEEPINYFWRDHKEKIKERLTIDERYQMGYEIAKKTIHNITLDKIAEYIELLNQGYKPRNEDKGTKFSNGEPINYFWKEHKEEIIERLTIDERYQEGYIIAKKTIEEKENKKISFDMKIAEYIELLNQGYKPRKEDKETKFSNGEPINYFWSTRNNKEKIKERLTKDERYQEGYEIAKKTIEEKENKKISFDMKIAEYIELLNQGYKPKYEDKKNKFSNGEPLNQFWSTNKEKIIERLTIDERYQEEYEIAKQIISFDKTAEYIELLNQGYIPKNVDNETEFTNGQPINTFWRDHKERIINKLFKELKDNYFYNQSRQTLLNYLKVKNIEEYYELEEKKKQLKELKNMKQNLENVDKSLEVNETISRKRA